MPARLPRTIDRLTKCVLCGIQFHSNYVAQFMKLMGEFVRFSYGLSPREKERYPSAETTLLFADTLCRLGNISRSHLDGTTLCRRILPCIELHFRLCAC